MKSLCAAVAIFGAISATPAFAGDVSSNGWYLIGRGLQCVEAPMFAAAEGVPQVSDPASYFSALETAQMHPTRKIHPEMGEIDIEYDVEKGRSVMAFFRDEAKCDRIAGLIRIQK